ncbi:MAG: hypothetical protein ABI947_02510 [Chloroflexota bacterium]
MLEIGIDLDAIEAKEARYEKAGFNPVVAEMIRQAEIAEKQAAAAYEIVPTSTGGIKAKHAFANEQSRRHTLYPDSLVLR